MERESLRTEYTEASKSYSEAAEHEEKKLFLISLARLITFAAGITVSWICFTFSIVLGIIALIGSLILFIWLIKLYSSHTDKKEFLKNLAVLNATEARVLTGDFTSLSPGNEYTDPDHPFSYDTDLFGNSSLFQYLNRTVTGYGRDILASWLKDPFPLSRDINKRQKAVRELAEKKIWRHNFIASGMSNPVEKQNMEPVIGWINDEATQLSGIHRYLIIILPATAFLTLSLLVAGVLHYSFFTLSVTINLLYVFSGIRNTGRIHNALSGRYMQLASVKKLLLLFETESFESEIMKDIRDNLAGRPESASESVLKLEKIIRAFDSRLNLIAGLVLNGLFLWDYQCIRRLEIWKRKNRGSFSSWLDMIGKADAFISLAGYYYNNQTYAFPVLVEDDRVISVKSMGHPLLEEKERICNDFELSGKGRVCVITGANMAGKSTFLRTLSVNLILAMNGAPVCGVSMLFRPVKLFTSMRTTDSLSSHESYFYAELKRLGQLKTLVENGEPVLFILDEILKGTNSNDKSLGSRLFIKKLIAAGGTGVIATHDISLGELDSEYSGILFNKCFEVEIDNDKISFDYILRDGITRKMNAAILMKQMGILD